MNTAPRTLTIRLTSDRPQHAAKILEHIINPALKDFGCTVSWPDMSDPEIAVTYDAEDLRRSFSEGA